MPHLELHLHTKAGSADSSISADALGERAAEQQTGGLVVTEHFRVWSDWEREAFEARWGVRVYPAVEVSTTRGHIIVLGAEAGLTLPGDVDAVLAIASERAWPTILAHPFRYYFDGIHESQRAPFPPDLDVDALADQPLLAAVDAIEIDNGGCTARENDLAASVATTLQKPVTFGSDAHHVDEVGGRRMAVPALPADVAELAELLLGSGVPGGR